MMGSFLHDFLNSMDDDDFKAERNSTFYAIKLFEKSVFNIGICFIICWTIFINQSF